MCVNQSLSTYTAIANYCITFWKAWLPILYIVCTAIEIVRLPCMSLPFCWNFFVVMLYVSTLNSVYLKAILILKPCLGLPWFIALGLFSITASKILGMLDMDRFKGPWTVWNYTIHEQISMRKYYDIELTVY